MKRIGLLGGMSWESSAGYYRMINEGVKQALGGLHSADLVMISVDFEPIEQLQHQGNWDQTGVILAEAAARVEQAGAEALVICTNTMHKVAPIIEQAIDIPLLHIADATAEHAVLKGMRCVGLLGTAFTLEQTFYRGRLEVAHGLDVKIPNEADRKIVHDVIYQELCLGQIHPESKAHYLDIIACLADAGAEAVILGCTEIGMLVDQSDTPVPLLDTTQIHAQKAIAWALS